jgi:glutamate-1-semialdehyde 2,1-aminomutase/spore coat polysaccharide biosynthesis protein SpsF
MMVFDEIFFSGTFGGEALSLAACKATIGELRRTDALRGLWSFGSDLSRLIEGLITRHRLSDRVRLLGLPVRSVLAFPQKEERETLLRRTYFMQECVKRGLLYFCSHIPCTAHGQKELDFTAEVLEEVFALFSAVERENDFTRMLEGPCVEAIFRRA